MRVVPSLNIVDGLHQWIISSDIAAYHPSSQTIWLKRQGSWRMLFNLSHERGHHVIHILGGNVSIQKLHEKI